MIVPAEKICENVKELIEGKNIKCIKKMKKKKKD